MAIYTVALAAALFYGLMQQLFHSTLTEESLQFEASNF